jgi:uncharacterized protein YkwD
VPRESGGDTPGAPTAGAPADGGSLRASNEHASSPPGEGAGLAPSYLPATGNNTAASAAPADSRPRTAQPPAVLPNERPEDEAKLVELINQTRGEKGLPPLTIDPRLSEAARKHTLLMVQYSGLSHQFPGEPPLEERFDNEQIVTDGEAENVSWSVDVVSAHHDLVEDPPHFRNVVDPVYNAVGIGIIRSGRHIFVTEDFAHIAATDSSFRH